MEYLNKTRAQLDALGNPFIGIQLKDGYKIFGKLEKTTKYTLYLVDRSGEIKDVPRRIIRKAFLLIQGQGESNNV